MSKKWAGKLVRFKSDPTFRVHQANTLQDGSVELLVTRDNGTHYISVNSNLMEIVGTYPAVNQVWENKKVGDRILIAQVESANVLISARRARLSITVEALLREYVMVLDA